MIQYLRVLGGQMNDTKENYLKTLEFYYLCFFKEAFPKISKKFASKPSDRGLSNQRHSKQFGH